MGADTPTILFVKGCDGDACLMLFYRLCDSLPLGGVEFQNDRAVHTVCVRSNRGECDVELVTTNAPLNHSLADFNTCGVIISTSGRARDVNRLCGQIKKVRMTLGMIPIAICRHEDEQGENHCMVGCTGHMIKTFVMGQELTPEEVYDPITYILEDVIPSTPLIITAVNKT